MIIHKDRGYIGRLDGHEVSVMPITVTAENVRFSIGRAFGNRTIYDGTQQCIMPRPEFEETFSLMSEEGQD